MHSDIAYRLASRRHAELMAAVAQQRLVDQAKRAHPGLPTRPRPARRWWWLLCPNRGSVRVTV